MAKGSSGRVVIEVDPNLKKDLYASLDQEGMTLKDWFIKSANRYVAEQVQPSLALPFAEKEGGRQ
jgi:hypothetical protein